MAELIAIAGKGGTGKTTFCGLIVRYLIENKLSPVLAIDADANLNFNEVLGIEVKETVGDIRDDLLQNLGMLEAGMDKDTWIELKLQEARSEEHTSELQSHSFISYAVFCLKKKKKQNKISIFKLKRPRYYLKRNS